MDECNTTGALESARAATPLEPAPAPQDNTTLLQNDEESFALAPVDATVLKGILIVLKLFSGCTLMGSAACL